MSRMLSRRQETEQEAAVTLRKGSQLLAAGTT